MKRRIILLVMIVLMAFFAAGCGMMTGPDDPNPTPPEEVKYYTIQVFYTRPEILRWDLVDRVVGVSLRGRIGTGLNLYAGTDKYNLIGEFEQKLPDNEIYGLLYEMWGLDTARWNGSDDTAVVGEIFKLRVKETGFEHQLVNIKNNNREENPYKGPSAKLACFRLMKDGTIKDD